MLYRPTETGTSEGYLAACSAGRYWLLFAVYLYEAGISKSSSVGSAYESGNTHLIHICVLYDCAIVPGGMAGVLLGGYLSTIGPPQETSGYKMGSEG